jgi:hypothetical protein
MTTSPKTGKAGLANAAKEMQQGSYKNYRTRMK